MSVFKNIFYSQVVNRRASIKKKELIKWMIAKYTSRSVREKLFFDKTKREVVIKGLFFKRKPVPAYAQVPASRP